MNDAPHPNFWPIVEAAVKDRNALRTALEPMSRAELLTFWRDWSALAYRLREPPFENTESDSQKELAWWVVGRGRAFYEDIVAHPEKFPTRMGPEGRGTRGTIGRVFWEKFDEEVTDADARDP